MSRSSRPARKLPAAGPNFMKAAVRIDGAPVEPGLDEQALLDGRDIGAMLRRHGLPLDPNRPSRDDPSLPEAASRAAALPDADREVLSRAGLVDRQAGHWPLWTYRAELRWSRELPPGQETVIDLAYEPVPGLVRQEKASYFRPGGFQDRFPGPLLHRPTRRAGHREAASGLAEAEAGGEDALLQPEGGSTPGGGVQPDHRQGQRRHDPQPVPRGAAQDRADNLPVVGHEPCSNAGSQASLRTQERPPLTDSPQA
ncbi:DUF4424 family protein [Microvirga roseola]|nr:DUF4424 family protein [Microvirga roseola]